MREGRRVAEAGAADRKWALFIFLYFISWQAYFIALPFYLSHMQEGYTMGRPSGTTKGQMKATSLRLPEELLKALEIGAASKGLNLASYIRMILTESIK